ncbi:MAG: tetratricopeptide repeat protein [Gemmatimonadetes bacterium]|nr:tetratricopeptide repeat protein [Gemmatimonadota bacterium]
MNPTGRGTTLLATILIAAACGQDAGVATGSVPLYNDLGDYHYSVGTSEPLAQQYFDQGLRLYYAFNHQEAVRAFREVQRLDPKCAMCWWGEALSWGPNINLPMDSTSGVAAYAAMEGALSVRGSARPHEQALIDALTTRYEAVPPLARAYLDSAYADAMATVAASYSDDHEIAVLYAESLLDLRPWDYWTADGEPQGGIAEALALLEGVVEADARHPGACHFFIHTVEKVYPERAVECAERLASLMPGAGHLVHMPGHIYVRVGRYLDAIESNQHAVHADETYIADQQPGIGMYTAGYYPHNYDFLAFAAMMIGRSQEAIDAAARVPTLLPPELFGSPGMDFLQHWSIRPHLFRIRFGRWEEILAEPAPPSDRPHSLGMWHYARGRALAASGDAAGAGAELEQLREIVARPELRTLKLEYNMSADLLGTAERVLTGWTEAAAGRLAPAAEALREAVRREDALLYGEPPEWTVPARHDLGALLLQAGRASEAEQVFRHDLDTFPDNGWSLSGLAAALRAQGRTADATAAESEFARVWSTADVLAPTW